MKNLYTFSKTSWHVRLFTWIYGTNPTHTFKTMCPYFWSFVLTILLIIPILVVKLFGKAGTRLLSKVESYKRDRRDKKEKEFIEKCTLDLSDEEAFNIKNSDGWFDFYHTIDWDIYNSIHEKTRRYNKYLTELAKQKVAKAKVRKQKVDRIKETKSFIYLSYVVSVAVIYLILFVLYSLFASLKFNPVDWDLVVEITSSVGKILGTLVSLFCIVYYGVLPFFRYLGTKSKTFSFILTPFKFIWKGIVIVADMIHMTYIKACPRITWVEKDKV